MNIHLIILDDSKEWLQIMKAILNDKICDNLLPKYYNDVNEFLANLSDKPTILVLDYFLDYITGVTVLEKALQKNQLIHPVFMSNATNVEMLLTIINVGWGFYFVPKDDTAFTEKIVKEICKAEETLTKKLAAVIKQHDINEQFKARANKILSKWTPSQD